MQWTGTHPGHDQTREEWTVKRFIATFVVFVSGASFANGNDSFQQVINYITTGDPLKQGNSMMTARIFDRENCVAGFTDNRSGTFKIHWNNVDRNSIDVGEQCLMGDGVLNTAPSCYLVLSLSGSPYVAESRIANEYLYPIFASMGITSGKHSSIAWPLDDVDPHHDGLDSQRLMNGLDILYGEHCTGLAETSAF